MIYSLLVTRITLIWLLLVTATVFSWEMGHGVGFDDFRHASVAIIAVAVIKVRFVLLDFMEIRHAPSFMRIIAEAWGLVICIALTTLYWHAGGTVSGLQ